MIRVALVVGIDDYSKSPLKSCVNDATAIARTLSRHHESANFEIESMLSPGVKVERKTLRKALETLFAARNEVSLFYFAGHGLLKSTGGYIVTADAERYDEGISMEDILTLANKSEALEKILILDCCHSGAFGVSASNSNQLSHLAEGVTVLAATRDTDTAIESADSGLFTELLLEALDGGAADVRGHITPGSVYAFIDQALGGFGQRPVFKSNVTRFTSLRRVAPRIAFDTLTRLATHFRDSNEVLSLTPAHEPTHPEADPNKVKIFQDLQKFFAVGLVLPVDADFMYYAAVDSKGCRLTALGRYYWKLIKRNKLYY